MVVGCRSRGVEVLAHGVAMRGLRKYNGIPKRLPLFLKVCEFRFNDGAHRQQLKTLLE